MADAGRVHVVPPFVLTSIPASELTRPSYHEVATTRFELDGSTSTSQAITGRKPFSRNQLVPPFVDLKIPPYSLDA